MTRHGSEAGGLVTCEVCGGPFKACLLTRTAEALTAFGLCLQVAWVVGNIVVGTVP